MPVDDRYRTPSIGTVAVMVDSKRELRIYTIDGGHELHLMLAENYRPTLSPTGDGRHYGEPGKSHTIRLRRPYAIATLIEALALLRTWEPSE